jgi:predicted RNA polymerase sigma factor
VAEPSEVSARLAEVVRSSYGRLIAALAATSGDLSLAEDALSEALRSALEVWPSKGIPDVAEAWLLTVARNRVVNERKSAYRRWSVPLEEGSISASETSRDSAQEIPDERLKLLFVCAHPAIEETIRTPLMLQTVLGVDAARIAAAYLVAPTTMGQRLSRAKRRIVEARIPFVVPTRSDMPVRLVAVLEALYGLIAIGFDDASEQGNCLGDEGLALTRLLVELMPDEPEVLGLAAINLHIEARRSARRPVEGVFVPLEQQETRLWNAEQIAEAEGLLWKAHRYGQPGRFQLEGAIQSAHAQRRLTGETDWSAIAILYEGLMRVAPGCGAAVGRGVAIGFSQGGHAGLAALDVIPRAIQEKFQPALVARAKLYELAGEMELAREALDAAIQLTRDVAVAGYLRREKERLQPLG